MLWNEIARIIRLFAGLTAYSLGIAMTVQANIGLAPWDVFHQGLALRLGITFGMASIAASAVIVVAVYLCGERFGVGTLLNMLYIGLVIDVLILGSVITKAGTLASGLVMFVAGLFIIAFATYLYIGAGYGAGPRDSLMAVLSRKTGRTAGFCRSVVELVVLVMGWALGGKAGLGTVICAFGIGAAVQIVFSSLRFDINSVSHESIGETLARAKKSPSALQK